MNIGVYLGTFNPPHIGHLNCLYGALETKIIDKILVVPAFRNPWKEKPSDLFDPVEHAKNGGMSLDGEFDLRVRLCEAMFRDLISQDKVKVSSIEYSIWRRSHKYTDDCIYSYETLEELVNHPKEWLGHDFVEFKEGTKVKFCILTTAETLSTMYKWKNGTWILSSFPILSVTTKHLDDIARYTILKDKEAEKILNSHPSFMIDDIPIHSTDLRQKFLNYQTLCPFVNKETEKILNDERKNVMKIYQGIKKLQS